MCKPKGCVASGCERGYECDKYSTQCKPQGCLASGCPSNSECDKTTLECKENKPLSVTEAPASPAAASAPALPCKDDDTNCVFWAAAGECTKNPSYMLQTCKLSCRAPGCPAPPVLPPTMEAPAITAAPAPSSGPADAPAPAPADALAPELPVV
ncbi:hypothetical protein COHA_005180 [Chlorella ohadii]|uniref:ShKT domain-containing protein n=1 Tax=Chlorella ohadii TaxID=2649997 RepID=A0AAD5DSJ9_9CHLO|nr:hypothetical protein COHA_005180 [Chlorella ohadii]